MTHKTESCVISSALNFSGNGNFVLRHLWFSWFSSGTNKQIRCWLVKYVFVNRSVLPASCVGSRATPRGTVPAASAPPAASRHTGSGPARDPHCGTNTASAVVWLGTKLTWASLNLSRVNYLLTFCPLWELKKILQYIVPVFIKAFCLQVCPDTWRQYHLTVSSHSKHHINHNKMENIHNWRLLWFTKVSINPP